MAMAEAHSEYEMSLQTTRLEKEYELVRANSTRLLDTERDRVRRMEYLLLQFDRDSLKSQLDQAREQLLGATQTEREARMQLEEAFQEIDRLDSHVQASTSEVKKLKAELSASNNTSSNQSTLLSEKLRLTRDLSNLQTELDRLRNQDSSYQTLISEKHDLERQLNSLEVQLENEKISHERTRTKSSQQATEINNLSARIKTLENDLARELRAKQESDNDGRQGSAEWESQRSVLEGKIETLKKQLQRAKDKLHEAQNELQNRRSNARIEMEPPEPRSRTVPLQNPGPGIDYNSGVTIATPGAVRVQDKLKRQSALPGDKSAFSITPYLNRTGKSREPPESSDMEQEQQQPARKTKEKTSTTQRGSTDEPGSPQARPVSTSTSTKAAPKTSKGKSKAQEKKPASRPPPAKTIEEEDEELEASIEPAQAKSKKRKLGGQRERSLFEDEEDEMGFELRKPGRKIGLSTAQLAGGSRNLGFGAPMGFSPLKKDRKRF